MTTEKRKNKFFEHLKSIGFTNRLSLYCLLFITFTLVAGFILAIMSLRANYLGSLICFTATLTPVATATSITLTACVSKSKSENTEGGVKYLAALASFNQYNTEPSDEFADDSSPIEPSDEPMDDLAFMPDDEDLSGDAPTI